MSVSGVDRVLDSINSLLRMYGFKCSNDFRHNDFYYAKMKCEWLMMSPFGRIEHEYSDKYGRTIYMRFNIPFEFYLVVSPLDRHDHRTVEKQLVLIYDMLKSMIKTINKHIKEYYE